MTVRRSTCFFALGLLVVALATSTGSAQPDPRTAEIKKRLERFGMKVIDVSFCAGQRDRTGGVGGGDRRDLSGAVRQHRVSRL